MCLHPLPAPPMLTQGLRQQLPAVPQYWFSLPSGVIEPLNFSGDTGLPRARQPSCVPLHSVPMQCKHNGK